MSDTFSFCWYHALTKSNCSPLHGICLSACTGKTRNRAERTRTIQITCDPVHYMKLPYSTTQTYTQWWVLLCKVEGVVRTTAPTSAQDKVPLNSQPTHLYSQHCNTFEHSERHLVPLPLLHFHLYIETMFFSKILACHCKSAINTV